jgi:hypothetical protein
MQRLKQYFPIFMIALMVQIFAPIGANWAFAATVSDPLAGAEICLHNSDASSQEGDQSGQHQNHDGSCILCCGFHASAAFANTLEPVSIAVSYRAVSRVVWGEHVPQLAESRASSNAKARAPPIFS